MGHLVVRFDLAYREAGRASPPAAEKSVPGYFDVFDAARSEHGEERWVVGGKSYGGRVASLAVAAGMGARGLIFYGYPLHAPGRADRPRVEHWGDIGVPSLFLQGSNDAFCDLVVLRDHLGLLQDARLEVVQGGDHSLKVSASRAPDGVARSPERVLSDLEPVIAEFLGNIGS